MVNMNTFLSKQNADTIIGIFREYMKDKFKVTLDPADSILNNLTIDAMQNITLHGHESLQDLNLRVLGMLRKYYVERLASPNLVAAPNGASYGTSVPAQTRIPTMDPLNRESQLFGARKVMFQDAPEPARPQHAPRAARSDAPKSLENVMAERDAIFARPPPPPPEIEPSKKELAESTEDFLAKVKLFERERSAIIHPPPTETPPVFTEMMQASQSQMQMPQSSSSHPLPPQGNPIDIKVFKTPRRSFMTSYETGIYRLNILSLPLGVIDRIPHIITFMVNDEAFPMKFVDYTEARDGTKTVMYEPILENSMIHITVEKMFKGHVLEDEVSDVIRIEKVSKAAADGTKQVKCKDVRGVVVGDVVTYGTNDYVVEAINQGEGFIVREKGVSKDPANDDKVMINRSLQYTVVMVRV